jgi:uncharacterized protein (TIGR03083 family)
VQPARKFFKEPIMTLPRHEVSTGLFDELSDFEKLVRSLDEQQWSTPRRCEGWTVGDVAAHVIGSMADVVGGRLDGLGTPEVTEREVQERRGRTPARLADECAEVREAAQGLLAVFDDAAWEAPAPGGYQGTLGDGVEALWFDTYLHADDMRSVLGHATQRTAEGDRASLSHIATELTKREWQPATLAFDGQPEFDVSGGGTRIDGDAFLFILAATGRGDASAIGLDDSVNLYA